ncbi:MAG: DUF1778 domain-containing protein [Gemmataceae bacterium]
MSTETRTTDAKGRLTLPKGFANATLLLERVSDTEIRIRKAKVVPEDEAIFTEERQPVLSDRDRDRFISLITNPPKPNKALKRAMAKYRKSRS